MRIVFTMIKNQEKKKKKIIHRKKKRGSHPAIEKVLNNSKQL